jgi:hypothetical protein
VKNVKTFENLAKEFPNIEDRNLLTKKGVYPYDYMTNMEKFEVGF